MRKAAKVQESSENKQASAESLLFKNPYVPRAADFGRTPRAEQLYEPGAMILPPNLPVWALTGGGVGSLIGALRAEKGKRLRGALRGGTLGASAGILGSFGAHAAAGIGDVEMAYHGKPHTDFSTPARIGTVVAPYALGGASALLGGHTLADTYDKAIQQGEEMNRKYHNDKKKKDKKKKDATNTKQSAQKIAKVYEASEAVEGNKPKVVYESHKKCTPCEFGMRVKEARLSHENLDVYGLGAMGAGAGGAYGGLAGLLGGGIYGALEPGVEDQFDAKGNVVGKKRRQRWLGAVRGGLGYGALGAGAGTAIGGLGGMALEGAVPGTFRQAVGPDQWNQMHEMKFQNDLRHDLQTSGSRLQSGLESTANGWRRLFEKRQSAFEFGQKMAAIIDPANAGMTGAGIGALIGALRAPEGKMLKYTLGGAGLGGLAGVGSSVGYNLVPGDAPPAAEMLRLPLAVGGGALTGHLGNKLYNEVEHHIPEKKDDKKKDEEKTAFAFGQKLAFNIDWNAIKTPALGGAALGALAGGAHGLMAPGQDEDGNPRNRFGAMLRGALGGGAVGGLGGAAMGHFAPEMTQNLYNLGRRTMTGKNQAQLNMGDNVARMTPQQQALYARAMRPFKPKAIAEQVPEAIQFPQQ